jgi:hypothetical protein
VPTEARLLETLSAEGKLRDVHQILAQYLLAREPNPHTGQHQLGIFDRAPALAINNNHPVVVAYLFFMRVGKPSDYIYNALRLKSMNMFQVFLDYGWDINQPVHQMSTPILGWV